jgi:hypothetical protein
MIVETYEPCIPRRHSVDCSHNARGVSLVGGTYRAPSRDPCPLGIHSPRDPAPQRVDTPGIVDNLHDHPSFRSHSTAAERRHGGLAITTAARGLVLAGLTTTCTAPDGVDVDRATPRRLAPERRDARPFRGTLRLASPDPTVDPIAEFAMLTDDRDWRRCPRRSIEPNTS